jgi:hypothetical protein
VFLLTSKSRRLCILYEETTLHDNLVMPCSKRNWLVLEYRSRESGSDRYCLFRMHDKLTVRVRLLTRLFLNLHRVPVMRQFDLVAPEGFQVLWRESCLLRQTKRVGIWPDRLALEKLTHLGAFN